LTGNQHGAEDLLQTALMKTAARWRQIRDEDPEAYVRTVLYREQISWWRRRGRHREVAVDPPPDIGYADPSSHTDLRLAMRAALLRLPPAQRAILVLRYYDDLSEKQVADILGCSVGYRPQPHPPSGGPAAPDRRPRPRPRGGTARSTRAATRRC